ncbi:RHS repeat-associated core domain protein-containing protein [Pseudomonas sp. GM78]|uniref:RHS repeat-associated core domain-containing protein n=1 Tax=Pseudomonas sp. GM78 TaxID=1144337 RepID=UPI000270B93B|nr:RHS repeat-associated core domain-containing protein [Pseudomonas sp. GM78]EJN30437.1 RHS repeat-associated core domain protein-containing protein [Pseudomonas sp. GM78]
MTTTRLQTVLCQYRYDALDRSITWTPDRQAGLQRFFCKDRLATEIHNAAQRSIFQHDDQVLAQQNRWGDNVDTTLLATDHQRSVLNAVDSTQAHRIAYTPYGHRPIGNGLLSLLGFNGERPDLVTGHYHLGNGYRQFNPVLMRFNSPDVLSPFGKGGVNAYAYCGNDPINWTDPNGSFRLFGIGKKSISTTNAANKANKIDTHAKNHFNEGELNQALKIDKYNSKSIEKIANKLDNYIMNARHHLETTKKALNGTLDKGKTQADLRGIGNEIKVPFINTTERLIKNAEALLLTPPSNPTLRVKQQYELFKQIAPHYSAVKDHIPNITTILKENLLEVRKT